MKVYKEGVSKREGFLRLHETSQGTVKLYVVDAGGRWESTLMEFDEYGVAIYSNAEDNLDDIEFKTTYNEFGGIKVRNFE